MKTGQPRPRTENLTPSRLSALHYIYEHSAAGNGKGVRLTASRAHALIFLDGEYYEVSQRDNVSRRYWLTEKGRQTVEWLLAVDSLH